MCKIKNQLSIAQSWSSLVQGDEQLDRPNSQTTMELCHTSAVEMILDLT